MFGIKLSHIIAGFIVVLVGYSSSVAIIFQAAEVLGATQAQINSWMLALGFGMGISGIILSSIYKIPILTAWSTPGAALLVVSLVGVPMGQAIGAFIFCSILLTLTGISGLFERITNLVPLPIANAMLAGVLFQFGLSVFTAMDQEFILVSVMLLAFLLGKIFFTRFNIPIVLLIGVILSAILGLYAPQDIVLEFAMPVFTMPEFNLATMISVGIPLYIVTMTSQNMPGVAAIRAAGYKAPVSASVTITGLTSLLLAPFGGYAFNLGAITAAIGLSPEADDDKKTRYKAGIVTGIFYCIVGLMGATIVSLFLVAPKALVVAIAGIALLGTIGNSLSGALSDDKVREASVICFLVTVSGISFWGIGAAFWGLFLGCLPHILQNLPILYNHDRLYY